MQEVKNHFHILGTNVRIRDNFLLTQKESCQLQQLSDMLLPDNHQVVLLDREESGMVLTDQCQ